MGDELLFASSGWVIYARSSAEVGMEGVDHVIVFDEGGAGCFVGL